MCITSCTINWYQTDSLSKKPKKQQSFLSNSQLKSAGAPTCWCNPSTHQHTFTNSIQFHSNTLKQSLSTKFLQHHSIPCILLLIRPQFIFSVSHLAYKNVRILTDHKNGWNEVVLWKFVGMELGGICKGVLTRWWITSASWCTWRFEYYWWWIAKLIDVFGFFIDNSELLICYQLMLVYLKEKQLVVIHI